MEGLSETSCSSEEAGEGLGEGGTGDGETDGLGDGNSPLPERNDVKKVGTPF